MAARGACRSFIAVIVLVVASCAVASAAQFTDINSILNIPGCVAAELPAMIAFPAGIVCNLANQVAMGYGSPLSVVGATLLLAGSPPEVGPPIAFEMVDGDGNIVGVQLIPQLVAIWAESAPYGATIRVDPATGVLLTYDIFAEDDPAPTPSVEEHHDDYGITAITYRGMPSAPIIGREYVYRLLVLVQVHIGPGHYEWLLERYPDWSASVVTVGPPYTGNMFLGGTDGNLATFQFHSPIGADHAIVQVARYPHHDFPRDQTYEQSIPGTWVGMEEHTLHSVQVDLSQVPETGNTYFWRIGAESSENVWAARTYPGDVPNDHGWVWSELNWFCWEAGQFTDVPTLHWAYSEIEACAQAGIVGGYPDGTYQPVGTLTRDQMAVYISRALAGGDENVPEFTGTPSFNDVPAGNWALDYVEYAVDQNVVQGYDAVTYAPTVQVDRAQMAVFIARAEHWVAIGDDMTTAPQLFPDVPAGF